MRVLVTGAGGQVGHELAKLGAIGLDRAALDITDAAAVASVLAEHAPDVVVNAAAYTQVDQAESEPELAAAINAEGAANLARVCAERDIPLIHISTDYVFDGQAERAYVESDEPHPNGVYARTKLDGERAVQAACPRHIILRTSWVFGEQGANFVKTMLRFGGERESLSVVADQRGGPTPADAIAEACMAIAAGLVDGRDDYGVYHFAGVPETSWHGLASAVIERLRHHRPDTPVQEIKAIATSDWPTPAPRPAMSMLNSARLEAVWGIAAPDWRAGVVRVVDALIDP